MLTYPAHMRQIFVFQNSTALVKLVHRTAEVWHPIEEFGAFAHIVLHETDRTLSPKARVYSAATRPFRADASEGFQTAAAAVISRDYGA